jgi:hypothetical protein
MLRTPQKNSTAGLDQSLPNSLISLLLGWALSHLEIARELSHLEIASRQYTPPDGYHMHRALQ